MNAPTQKVPFDIYLPATADKEAVFVETIEVEVYENFGEGFLPAESSELIKRTRARHMGYLHGKDNGEHGTEWLVSLEISQTIPEGANLPYVFTLRIQGTVAASPHLSGARLQRAMHANGPAMLFGAAREIIRAASGRGPWPAVIIPSTNFLADLPPLEAPAKAPGEVPAPAKKASAKKATTKKATAKTKRNQA